MKKIHLYVIAFGLMLLFFIQMAGTLVESIYILDLMNTSLDEKALGVLFFFTPILLLPFRRKIPNLIVWSMIGLLVLARGASPYFNTLGRMLVSGIGTGAVLLLFPLMMSARPRGKAQGHLGWVVSAALALGVGLSVLLRALDFGIDYSLTTYGGWVGWLLAILFGFLAARLDWPEGSSPPLKRSGLTSAVVGIFLILTLVYFTFSAPAVIARWTEGNYAMIVLSVSLLAAAWAWLSLHRKSLIDRISPQWLTLWNLAFMICLVGTILVHRVPFPPTPESPAVVVYSPSLWQQLPMFLMLLLFPVIFVDMRVLVERVSSLDPTPRTLVPGMLLGCTSLVLLVFINIFTNVWGYVEPISTVFRNMYWLPYLLITALLTLCVWMLRKDEVKTAQTTGEPAWGYAILLGLVFLGTGISVLRTGRAEHPTGQEASLTVMTYNIQAANDDSGERSYERQLALIRQVSPDILALQESDTARISLNNNDYVLHYASKLGYYVYYGPTTVTGTFGTAILSKYPLSDMRTVFTFSDQDEIGTAEAEIDVNGRRITIYNVHPDGSDTAMLTWAKTLLERSQDDLYVIALGDFNLRDYEEAYQLIDDVYLNAWVSEFPDEVGSDGTDMSGDNRIDHIFVSPTLGVRDPVYVLPPDSATDHPVHWAEITWVE